MLVNFPSSALSAGEAGGERDPGGASPAGRGRAPGPGHPGPPRCSRTAFARTAETAHDWGTERDKGIFERGAKTHRKERVKPGCPKERFLFPSSGH